MVKYGRKKISKLAPAGDTIRNVFVGLPLYTPEKLSICRNLGTTVKGHIHKNLVTLFLALND
jgi:hypothetical protein